MASGERSPDEKNMAAPRRSFWGLTMASDATQIRTEPPITRAETVPQPVPQPAAQETKRPTPVATVAPPREAGQKPAPHAVTMPVAEKREAQEAKPQGQRAPVSTPAPAPQAMADVPLTRVAPKPVEHAAQGQSEQRPPAEQAKSRTEETATVANNAPEAARTPDPATAEQSPLPRVRFTPDQIRELQALASKALNSARSVSGTGEANFQWRHDELGVLQFRVVTRAEEVSIDISSNRPDVADALGSDRATVERMIADVGLKVERFEVRLRSDNGPGDLLREPRDHPDQRQRPAPEMDSQGGGDGFAGDEAPPAPPPRQRLADHEWVA